MKTPTSGYRFYLSYLSSHHLICTDISDFTHAETETPVAPSASRRSTQPSLCQEGNNRSALRNSMLVLSAKKSPL